jgi:hypothetical protein
MTTSPGVEVTLSGELLRHLRGEARKLGVPLQWLVAALVVDTVETVEHSHEPVAA